MTNHNIVLNNLCFVCYVEDKSSYLLICLLCYHIMFYSFDKTNHVYVVLFVVM